MPKPKLYTAFGESKKWGAWVKDDRCVVDSEALRSRLRYDWDFERALTEPQEDRRKMLTAYGETKSIREWVDDPRNVSKASYTTLQARLNSLGMEIEEALEFEGRDFQTYEAFGESKGWGDWLKDDRITIPARTIRTRLASGLSFEKSITQDYIQPKLYEAFGENKTAAEWFKDSRCVASYDLLNNRLSRGWDAKAAITTPAIEPIKINGQTLSELEESTGLPVKSRLRRGASPGEAISSDFGPLKYDLYGESKTAREWAEDKRCVVSISVVYSRLAAGLSIEDTITKRNSDGGSQPEKVIVEFLNELGYETISNTRDIIPPQEIDIFLPEINVGIEFNGIYWHSDLFKDQYYHQDKFKAAQSVGVDLIFVWEDDWIFDSERCLSNLKIALTNPSASSVQEAGSSRISHPERIVGYSQPQVKFCNDRFSVYDAGECFLDEE